MKKILLMAVGLLGAGWGMRAEAHVTLEPVAARSGGYAKLVFRVPHGCDGSATTKITVQIPEGVLSVKPQVHPGWKISTRIRPVSPPVTMHGMSISESTSEVTWSGGPLPDAYMDEFGLSVKLPDRPGKDLYFPVIQTCKKGVSRWVEIPNEGPEHSALPAPSLRLEGSPPGAPENAHSGS